MTAGIVFSCALATISSLLVFILGGALLAFLSSIPHNKRNIFTCLDRLFILICMVRVPIMVSCTGKYIPSL